MIVYLLGSIANARALLGHEAGHGTLSQYSVINHIVGYGLHTVHVHLFRIFWPWLTVYFLVPSCPILFLEIHSQCTSCILNSIFCFDFSDISTLPPQKATSSVERDENYVPRTRSDYSLPPAHSAQLIDYHEIFEETPIYTLLRMLAMQALGWQFYLLTNAMGSPMYPDGTNVSSLLYTSVE